MARRESKTIQGGSYNRDEMPAAVFDSFKALSKSTGPAPTDGQQEDLPKDSIKISCDLETPTNCSPS